MPRRSDRMDEPEIGRNGVTEDIEGRPMGHTAGDHQKGDPSGGPGGGATSGAKAPEGPAGANEGGREARPRWKIALLSAAIIALLLVLLWPKPKPKETVSASLPRRTAPFETPSYLRSYRAGLNHMQRKEYGEAVLDFEDALSAKRDYYPAQQKLEEAKALGELDAMVKRNRLSAEAADLKSPVPYSAVERKIYELEGISFRKAIEGGPRGSKVDWWGIVVGQADGGFTVENPKLRQVFIVRSNAAPEVGAIVEVYGRLAGVAGSASGASSPFPVPIVDADILDSTGRR